MSANKALIERWFEEVWNKGRAEAIDEMLAADAPMHGLGAEMRGPAGFKPFHARFRDALTSLQVTIEDTIEEGDKVAVRISVTAMHTGSGLGLLPTMRPVAVGGLAVARIRDGRIAEGWNSLDQLGMFQQLGAINLPA